METTAATKVTQRGALRRAALSAALLSALAGCMPFLDPAQEEELRVGQVYVAAYNRAQSGDAAGGRRLLDDLVRTTPTVDAHQHRATFIMGWQQDRIGEAAEDWRWIISHLEGKVLTGKEKLSLQMARQRLQSAETLGRMPPEVLRGMAQASREMMKPENLQARREALRVFQARIAPLTKDLPEFGERAGRVGAAIRVGERRRAIEEFQRVLELDAALRLPSPCEELSRASAELHPELAREMESKTEKMREEYMKTGRFGVGFVDDHLDAQRQTQGLGDDVVRKAVIAKVGEAAAKEVFFHSPLAGTLAIYLGDDAVEPLARRLREEQCSPAAHLGAFKLFRYLYPTVGDAAKKRIAEALLDELADPHETQGPAPSWTVADRRYLEFDDGTILGTWTAGDRRYFEADGTVLYLARLRTAEEIGSGTVTIYELPGFGPCVWRKADGTFLTPDDERAHGTFMAKCLRPLPWPSHPVRAAAVETLGQALRGTAEREAVERICRAFPASHADARCAAVRAMARIANIEDAIAFAEEALAKDRCWLVREQAAKTLGELRARRSTVLLRERLSKERVPPVRAAIQAALAAL
ncbi:MAG: HEAT repeat domain-containing protein [Planctomycetes bacterium]|nr:HEAT repeat domain-containing protein [Planctomycetota bacterium]